MKTLGLARVAIVLSLSIVTAAGAGEAAVRLELKLPAAHPEVFERVEIAVNGVPAAANRFDPESMALDLEVTPPSGKQLRVPGFFQRDFERRLEGNREVLTPRGEGGWRIRWLLDRACDWPDGATVADPAAVAGAKVTLAGVDDGPWAIEWWDTLEGRRVGGGVATATGGAVRLEPPAFQVDIAARLKKR